MAKKLQDMKKEKFGWSKKTKNVKEQEHTGTVETPESTAATEPTTEADASKQPDLSAQLEQFKKELDEMKDKYVRLFAEFDNYKKRTLKEKVDLMRTAAQETIVALLPVLDDFDRAKQNAEKEGSTEPFSEGIRLVYNKLANTLRAQGLEPMETNGETFDPEMHEAFTEFPAPTEDLKGKIVDTIEKGYKLGDKIIRHAKVVVGK